MQIGTGWLGWTERETLDTAIPTIEMAYDALIEKLWVVQEKRIAKPADKSKRKVASADSIFAAFRQAATQGHR